MKNRNNVGWGGGVLRRRTPNRFIMFVFIFRATRSQIRCCVFTYARANVLISCVHVDQPVFRETGKWARGFLAPFVSIVWGMWKVRLRPDFTYTFPTVFQGVVNPGRRAGFGMCDTFNSRMLQTAAFKHLHLVCLPTGSLTHNITVFDMGRRGGQRGRICTFTLVCK